MQSMAAIFDNIVTEKAIAFPEPKGTKRGESKRNLEILGNFGLTPTQNYERGVAYESVGYTQDATAHI